MENFEKYLKLQEKGAEIRKALEPLSESIGLVESELDRLKAKALEASVLEDKSAGRLSSVVEERTARLEAMKREAEDKKKTLEIIDRELGRDLQLKALADVRRKYRGAYESVARMFFAKLREAERLEEKLLAISREAEGMAFQVGGAREVLPSLERVCISRSLELGDWSAMRHFEDDCQRAGIGLE